MAVNYLISLGGNLARTRREAKGDGATGTSTQEQGPRLGRSRWVAATRCANTSLVSPPDGCCQVPGSQHYEYDRSGVFHIYSISAPSTCRGDQGQVGPSFCGSAFRSQRELQNYEITAVELALDPNLTGLQALASLPTRRDPS